MNMVGTPYSDVHRSWGDAFNVAAGSNRGAGITMVDPWVVEPRFPMTIPKQ